MASHDLHFNVEGGGGGNVPRMQSGSSSSPSNQDIPIQGEMDHLPDNSGSTMYNNNNMDNNMDNNNNSMDNNSGIAAYVQNRLKESAHPTACIFHVLFKACALTLYIFGYWFIGGANSSNSKQGDGQAHFITLTVASILLLAADFWVVKNVTGRLLVGLRWWNQVHDDDTKWIFECADDDRVVNKFDQSIFWTVLYATPVVWALLFITGLLKFQVNWLLIVCIALCLSLSNVYGYYKCSKDQNVKFQQMMQTTAQQGAMHVMRTNMLSVLTGTSAQGGTPNPSNTYV